MSDIYTLARRGRLPEQKLDEFLQNSDIDAEGSQDHRTLLVEAARKGHYDTVKLLLRKGAEVNKRGIRGRTPLHDAVGTRNNREKTVKAILEAKADVDASDDDGNTPLIKAVNDNLGLPVLRLLMDHGASPDKKNKDEKSALDLANDLQKPDIRRVLTRKALSSEELHSPNKLGFIDRIVSFVLFILGYINSGAIRGVAKGVVSSLYGIAGNSPVDTQLTKDIQNPKTVDDFKKNIDNFVVRDQPELADFFAPGNDFFQKVAEKAVKLKNDPDNYLTEPDQIKDLTRIALYQTIIYCDDSGSMNRTDTGNTVNRQELLRRLVTRMSSVAARLVPDGEGVHLRFINKKPHEGSHDSLNKEEIDKALDFLPKGGTYIGERLRERILKPLVLDKLAQGETLKRPILILAITDGCPTDPDPDTFKNAIIECGRALDDKNYEPEAVRFLVSCIGRDEAAVDFVESVGGDPAIERVVHRTSRPLDGICSELQKNERHVEEWLLDVLISPILGGARSG